MTLANIYKCKSLKIGKRHTTMGQWLKNTFIKEVEL